MEESDGKLVSVNLGSSVAHSGAPAPPAQITIDDLNPLRQTIQQSMILTRKELDEKAKRVRSYVECVNEIREIISRHAL